MSMSGRRAGVVREAGAHTLDAAIESFLRPRFVSMSNVESLQQQVPQREKERIWKACPTMPCPALTLFRLANGRCSIGAFGYKEQRDVLLLLCRKDVIGDAGQAHIDDT